MEKGFKLKTVQAFVATDKDGTEGIIGQLMPDNSWMPFVGADEKRILALTPLAQKIATNIKQQIKLVKFSVREDVYIIEP